MTSFDVRKSQIQRTASGPMVVGPADEIIELMLDADDAVRRVDLAVAALRLDPACIEAHLVLADHAVDSELVLLHLAKAVAAGVSLWTPFAEATNVAWWDSPGTRPYMRAIHALGQLLVQEGELERARKLFEKLLDADPLDRLRVGEGLAALGDAVPRCP